MLQPVHRAELLFNSAEYLSSYFFIHWKISELWKPAALGPYCHDLGPIFSSMVLALGWQGVSTLWLLRLVDNSFFESIQRKYVPPKQWPLLFVTQQKNVRMIAVGVGSSINDDELKQIADGKRENVIHVDKFDDLVSNENNVLFASCEPGNWAVTWQSIFLQWPLCFNW